MEATKTSPPAQTHWAAGKKIIIAGAGIAGLSFAVALQKHWAAATAGLSPPPAPIVITIYERDPKSVSVDREGYSLSIRGDARSGGMQVLQKLGLLDDLLAVSVLGTRGTGGFKLWDNKWNEIIKLTMKVEDNDLPAPVLRIARNLLRKGLLHAVTAGIHWETYCINAHSDQFASGGKVQVTLSNGQIDQCDIFIAADGASSKIRACLRPDDKLCFTGAVSLSGSANFPDGIPVPVDTNFGSALSGTGTGVFVSPIDQHRALWSISYLASEPRRTSKGPLPKEEFDALIEEALERGKSYAEPFQTLVRQTDPETIHVFNANDKQPFPHTDTNHSAVIFIGDANHAMSPFSGNGANMALMDGYELAEQICSSDSLATAIAAYDARSVPRSKSAIRFSRWTIELVHAQGFKLMSLTWFLRVMIFLRWL